MSRLRLDFYSCCTFIFYTYDLTCSLILLPLVSVASLILISLAIFSVFYTVVHFIISYLSFVASYLSCLRTPSALLLLFFPTPFILAPSYFLYCFASLRVYRVPSPARLLSLIFPSLYNLRLFDCFSLATYAVNLVLLSNVLSSLVFSNHSLSSVPFVLFSRL